MSKWRCFAVSGCLLVISMQAFADSLNAQRQRYLQIKQAWDNNQMFVVQQLLPKLHHYPLYPYLEYRYLTRDLSQVKASQISEFIAKHPTLPPARSLAARFVNELASRKDWQGLLLFSPEPPVESNAARCNFYYAKWATGEQEVAFNGADRIWLNGQLLPDSCEKLFTVWREAKHQTRGMTLERIRLALEEDNTPLLNILVKQLPEKDQSMGRMLVSLQNNPRNMTNIIGSVQPTDFTRAVSSIIFARLARQNASNAGSMIPTIARLQKMNSNQRLVLEETVAQYFMGADVTDKQTKWRDKVLMKSHSAPLLERRARIALGTGSLEDLKRWIERFPQESKDKDEWCYWRASLLLNEGKKNEGEAILRKLIKKRGFYPMVAAQKLNVHYPIAMEVAARPHANLYKRPEIARIRELMYWNMDSLARTEWNYFVASRHKSEQAALARYAHEQKWNNLGIQATIVAGLWGHLKERFPLVWPNEFHKATAEKGITPSYAMAVARQESAWDPKAQSSAGAVGLMQIMPRTAEYTAKKNKISGYIHSKQLLDPVTNIRIGTVYLETVHRQFGQNRILSSAAYNAGPSRVNTWLGKSEGKIDAIAFIESIPFVETRNYVKNVLAYDMFYRHFINRPSHLSGILSDTEWQKRY